MSLVTRARAALAAFRGEPLEPERLPTRDAAWSDSLIYRGADFPRYNPDGLIRRKGHHVYKRMMLDEQVKAVVRFRRDATTGRDWSFEADVDELGEEEADRRVRLFERLVSRMPGSWSDALNGVMTSIHQGFSVSEKVYQQVEVDGRVYWGLRRLRVKPFDSFRFDTDEFGNLERVVQEWDGEERELDPRRFVHHVHNPEVDEHYGQSELREAYRAWFSKDVVVKLRNIFLERAASGFVWLQPREGVEVREGSAEHQAIQSVLDTIQVKTGLLVPHGFDLHVENPRTQPAYQEAIASEDKAIAKALLVPNLLGISEQGQVGSFSQSQTQLEAFLWVLDAEAERLAETLNEQLFKELGHVNFGDDLYPRFTFKPLSMQQKLEIAKTWQTLVSGGAAGATDTDEGYIRELLGFPERGEPTGRDRTPSVEPEPRAGPGVEPEPGAEPDPDLDPATDRTIVGEGVLVSSRAAFVRALRRVNFAVIDRKSRGIEQAHAGRLAMLLTDGVTELVERKVEGEGLGTEGSDPKAVTDLKIGAKHVRRLRAATRELLREGLELGQRHAGEELERAGGEVTARRVRYAALGDKAEAFFEAKAFQMAGVLSDTVLERIKSILLSGIKQSKTTGQLVDEIYKRLESEGLIEAGKGPGKVKNPRARIETAVRTNVFEALNEGRMNLFNEAGDFVVALQYSAILDGRTTDICTELDGNLYEPTSPLWETFRPPNHFNCRSLLVAVTRIDEFDGFSEPPEVEPQQGFG